MRRYIREITESNPSDFDGIDLSETTRRIRTSPQLQVPRDPTHAFTVNVNIEGAKSRSLVSICPSQLAKLTGRYGSTEFSS